MYLVFFTKNLSTKALINEYVFFFDREMTCKEQKFKSNSTYDHGRVLTLRIDLFIKAQSKLPKVRLARRCNKIRVIR